MSEINKLEKWMDANGYTIKSLASELGVGYYGVYLVLHRKRISPGFRIRFSQRFGNKVADSIFDPYGVKQSSVAVA